MNNTTNNMNQYLDDEDIKYLTIAKESAIGQITKRNNKQLSHLFRLIGEGIELLTTSHITFPRPDADELLAIRHGKYTYDELMEKLGEDVDANFKSIEDKIILPHNPNRKEADKLCQKLVKQRLGYA
ncbi:MAG: hypothetical protein WC389_21775 [Lutibacter sp.]|jgi:hypothetical protein